MNKKNQFIPYSRPNNSTAELIKNSNSFFEKMQERRKERFFNFMYLHDETQDVAKAYGAQVTPHFFVLDKDRKVQYQGNFDDNWENPEAVNISELKNAIKALIEGKEVSVKETPVVGCSIKWKHGNAPNE